MDSILAAVEIASHRRRALGALALGTALAAGAACTTGDQWVYEKSSASAAQVDRDMAACEGLSRPRGPFAYPALTRVDRERFNACMQARGYRVSQESER